MRVPQLNLQFKNKKIKLILSLVFFSLFSVQLIELTYSGTQPGYRCSAICGSSPSGLVNECNAFDFELDGMYSPCSIGEKFCCIVVGGSGIGGDTCVVGEASQFNDNSWMKWNMCPSTTSNENGLTCSIWGHWPPVGMYDPPGTNAKWDASEGKCVTCYSDHTENSIYGNTSGLYCSWGSCTPAFGDQQCESACGAADNLDEEYASTCRFSAGLTCPTKVDLGASFSIDYSISGTDGGMFSQYEVQTIERDGIEEVCWYNEDNEACKWHDKTRWLTAPSTGGTYTYTVKCTSGANDETFCGLTTFGESKTCDITVCNDEGETCSASTDCCSGLVCDNGYCVKCDSNHKQTTNAGSGYNKCESADTGARLGSGDRNSYCTAHGSCDEKDPNSNAACDTGSGDIYWCNSVCNWALTEDCSDTCSGETSPSPLTSDSVTDYHLCSSGDTSCPSTVKTDECIATCTGTPTSCGSYADQASCEGCGCTWTPGQCVRDTGWNCCGEIGISCEQFHDLFQVSCTGMFKSCSGYCCPPITNPTSCNNENGCIWEQGSCSGTLTSCDSIGVTSCESCGCIFTVTNNLREYYCSGNDYTSQSIDCTTYGSKYICSNGVCMEDECDSDADCDDGNLCTNDWCENPALDNSLCHNDPEPAGTDCTGPGEYCMACDNSGNCNQMPADDPDCGNIDCSGWYIQTGIESPSDTEYCYNKQDITSNRCEGFGNCKDANSLDCVPQPNDAIQYSCDICKYIASTECTGTNRGSCSNYGTSSQCNSAYACCPGSGDNRYDIGGIYSCQGYCDGWGNCDYADNCICSQVCGAECDEDIDCSCPSDVCVDYDGDSKIDDYLDYPPSGTCLATCTCDIRTGFGQPCYPEISIDNETKCGIIFRIWVDESRIFTIAREELVNIYVHNLGASSDSYTISYTKEGWIGPNPADQLIWVSIPSDRIHSLEPGKVGNTFATITVLGPITYGKVTFTIASETVPTISYSDFIEFKADYPINLPEFELIGLMELLILACLILVVSYLFHFR